MPLKTTLPTTVPSQPDSQPHVLDPQFDLPAWLSHAGQPAWRAKAIYRWLHARRAESFSDMTDLPSDLRLQLQSEMKIWTTDRSNNVHTQRTPLQYRVTLHHWGA